MPLTELQAKKSKPRDKAYKLADGKDYFCSSNPTDRNYGG
ncbi:hypothetical protein GGQ88_000008 [Novosphingobium hassiacum]|uniref:Uncharacterized protein n=1 Tax=Novosphingobium hassiacum TaxID=173676 RepID=A0A7W6EU01_9SPHN|nr:hypothetical protein [Novosphingobium hassiacum]